MTEETPRNLGQAEGAAPEISHHARHAATGTLKSFAAGLIVIPVGLVTAIFVTRQLGPERYGLLAVTVSIMMWVEVAVGAWLVQTAVRLIAEADDWHQVAARIARTQLGFATAGGLIMFAGAGVIAGVLRTPELAPYIRLASFDVPIFAMTGMYGAVITGRGRFGQRATLMGAYWISRLILVVTLVALSPSVEFALIALIGASLVTLIGAKLFVPERLLVRSSYPWRRIWSFGWPLLVLTLTASLLGSLDILFVRSLVSQAEETGFLGSAKNLTVLPGTFIAALAPVLMTKLTGLPQHGEYEMARAMARRATRLVLCMLPFAAMTAGAASEIVTLVYGEPFSGAGPVLAVLIFAAIGGGVTGLATVMLIAAGRPRLPLVYVLPQTVLGFGMYWLMTSWIGTMGAVVTTTALAWMGASAAVALANVHWRLLPLAPTLVRCLGCSAVAFVIASSWSTPGPLLLVKLGVIAAVIATILYATGEVSRRDLRFLRSILRPAASAEQA